MPFLYCNIKKCNKSFYCGLFNQELSLVSCLANLLFYMLYPKNGGGCRGNCHPPSLLTPIVFTHEDPPPPPTGFPVWTGSDDT